MGAQVVPCGAISGGDGGDSISAVIGRSTGGIGGCSPPWLRVHDRRCLTRLLGFTIFLFWEESFLVICV